MPSGKIHALATCIAAGAISPLIYLSGQSIPNALTFAGGCIIGLLVTPDLDVRHWDTHSKTILRRSAGSLAGALWNLIWLPYARFIPRHRHPLSHGPLQGTALRVAYLLALTALIWWLLGYVFPMPALSHLALTPAIWWALGGLALVDVLHWGMDMFL